MTRYEGARFSDGSVALRRLSDDPCERHTLTFETVRECNEDLGREDLITWVADEVPRPAPRAVTVRTPNAQEVAYLLRHPERPFPGPLELGAAAYEPTEETEEQ